RRRGVPGLVHVQPGLLLRAGRPAGGGPAPGRGGADRVAGAPRVGAAGPGPCLGPRSPEPGHALTTAMRLSGALVLLLVVGCGGPPSGRARRAAGVDPFAALRTVPLTLTQLPAGQPCAASEPRDLDPSFRATLGAGPVYVLNPIVQVGRPSKVA